MSTPFNLINDLGAYGQDTTCSDGNLTIIQSGGNPSAPAVANNGIYYLMVGFWGVILFGSSVLGQLTFYVDAGINSFDGGPKQ